MSILVVKDYGISLRYRKGLVLITRGNEILNRIPLSSLEKVYILTSGVNFSSKLVRALVRASVDVIFMDHKGYPIAKITPPHHTRTILTKRLQYEAYHNEKGVEIAKAVAISKIKNQAGMLRYIARNRADPELKDELRKAALLVEEKAEKVALIQAKKIDLIRNQIINLEAEAARIYWPEIAKILPEQLEFEARDQKGEDLFNMMLNYGYGILKNECWRALLLVGLDPYAGYLHVDRSGRPSLILDFMEQFRQPIVDRTLIALVSKENPSPQRWIEGGRLTAEARAKIAQEILLRLESKVRVGDIKVKLETLITKQARKLARYLRGEEGTYKGYIERW